jgi:hypothetical protein
VRVSAHGVDPLPPPTAPQRLLLAAATQPAAEAVAAWQAWRQATTVDELEPASQWLLPLLYCGLRAAGVEAAALGRYASVYRHNWYKNQVRLRTLRPGLEALQAKGHAPVLAGGAAWAAAYYPGLGARPFEHVSLYAPRLTPEDRAQLPEVRWHISPPLAGTRQVTVAGQRWQVPDPVTALVVILAGGAQADDRSGLLWAADALVVGRHLEAEGWAAVAQQTRKLGLAEPVQARLAWLEAAGLLHARQTA